jgi:hypothetical protein
LLNPRRARSRLASGASEPTRSLVAITKEEQTGNRSLHELKERIRTYLREEAQVELVERPK